MTLLTAVASLFSGVVAATGWMGHQIRSLSVAPRAWACLECGVPNELDRDTCWSCGAGYGEDPLYASRIPFDRRWLCAECAVWNGIARMKCWRCGATHEVSNAVGGPEEGSGLTTTAVPGPSSSASTRAAPPLAPRARTGRRNT